MKRSAYTILLFAVVTGPAFSQEADAKAAVYKLAGTINICYDQNGVNIRDLVASREQAKTVNDRLAKGVASGKLPAIEAVEIQWYMDGVYQNLQQSADRQLDAHGSLILASAALEKSVEAIQAKNYAESLKQSAIGQKHAKDSLTSSSIAHSCQAIIAEFLSVVSMRLSMYGA